MKARLICFGSLVGVIMAATVSARDLGVVGETSPIKEQDLLEVITTKLHSLESSGALELHQRKLIAKFKKRVMDPIPTYLPEATKEREHYYDPTITVENDLADHKGRIFHKKGERINPLNFYQFRGKWIFFDATSKKQCLFVKTRYKPGEIKLILINGSPLKLMKKWKIPLFFDQQGILIKKLAIEQVPAIVEQDGLRLKITEVDLSK